MNIDDTPQSFSDVVGALRYRSSTEINPNTVLDDEGPTRQPSAPEADVPPHFHAQPRTQIQPTGPPAGSIGPKVAHAGPEGPTHRQLLQRRRLSRPRRLQRSIKTHRTLILRRYSITCSNETFRNLFQSTKLSGRDTQRRKQHGSPESTSRLVRRLGISTSANYHLRGGIWILSTKRSCQRDNSKGEFLRLRTAVT